MIFFFMNRYLGVEHFKYEKSQITRKKKVENEDENFLSTLSINMNFIPGESLIFADSGYIIFHF